MKVMLDNSEIVKALIESIANQGVDLEGKEIEAHLTAGRGANGHSATIEILAAGQGSAISTDESPAPEEAVTAIDEPGDEEPVFG